MLKYMVMRAGGGRVDVIYKNEQGTFGCHSLLLPTLKEG